MALIIIYVYNLTITGGAQLGMSETKKTLYKRETAISALMDLANKLTDYTSKLVRVPFYDEIKDVIIFGSFAKGADRVHDLDVYLEIVEHREMDEKFWELWCDGPYDPIKARYEQLNTLCRCLRGKRRIYSFHSDVISAGDREIAMSDVHYFIMKDGEVDYDELEKLFVL